MEVGAGRIEETLEVKRDQTVNVACSGKNVSNWQTASYCQVLSSWWFGEGKGKRAWITKCSSRTVGDLTHNCTTAAVHSLTQKLYTYVSYFCSQGTVYCMFVWKSPTLWESWSAMCNIKKLVYYSGSSSCLFYFLGSVKEIPLHFGKYSHLLSCWEFD